MNCGAKSRSPRARRDRVGQAIPGHLSWMQLLFDMGYENGRHEGLGVLRGEVVRFDLPEVYSVPHMGWNQLDIARCPPVLQGVDPGTYVYFVHSYYVVPQDTAVIATTTDYGGPFCSMILRENVFAIPSSIRKRVSRTG